MTNHSPIRSMRALFAVALQTVALLTLASCKKEPAHPSGTQFTSLLFDATSPAAREALATPVSFRLTEENYAQWEQAQRFLDAVPRSDFSSAPTGNGSAIDRAVAALEASPRARTAIERTGLSVRDFVLETVALAQAAEARSGKSSAGVAVPPENVQFVQQYESRIMQPRTQAQVVRSRADSHNESDTIVGVQSPTEGPPRIERGVGVVGPDSPSVNERGRARDSVARAAQKAEEQKPPVDTARDTIPQ